MAIVLILIGLLLGAGANEGTGAFIGAGVGWLIWRSTRQQREIEGLKQQLSALAASRASAEASAEASVKASAPAAAVAPVEQTAPLLADEAQPHAEPVPPTAPGATPAMPATMPAAAAGVDAPFDPLRVPDELAQGVWGATSARSAAPDAAPDAAPAATKDAATAASEVAPNTPSNPIPPTPGLLQRARGWFFGGNTIVKAGIGILFIGLAFLAKYASEQVQLPIELRLASVAAVALVLLVLGWRLRTRRAAYAQVLQGGAIAALYLTLFSAFKFYGVLGAGSAFALMALVAALAAALAVLQDARALAVVGALGGFATPLLLASGSGNHVGLFGYYLVLCLGIAAVAWFRTWRELNLIGFFFSFGVATFWGLFSYRAEHYATSQAFLIAFFLVFMAVLLLPARRVATGAAPPAGERWVNGSLLFGLPTLAFGLQYGLVKDMAYGPALSALAAAAFYVALAWRLRGKPQLALAFEGCLAVGTVFVTLVIPFALDARAVSGAWALEGAGLVWLGWRQGRRLARALGYLLLLIAGGLLMHAVDRHGLPNQWLNATALSGLMLLAGALIAAYLVQRHAKPEATANDATEGPAHSAPTLSVSEAIAEPLLLMWALLAGVTLVMLHVQALVPPLFRLSAGVVGFALLAALFVALAARLNWRGAAAPVLAWPVLMLLAALMSADFQTQPLAQGGWWAWPLALGVHALALRRAAPLWPEAGAHVAHAVGALVLALLGAGIGRGLLAEAGDAGSAWPWLGWLATPALLALALPSPRLASLWPLRELPLAYQRSAALVLCAALLVWTLGANWVSNGRAAPLPYVPFINPLDLGVALALFAAWRSARVEPLRGTLAALPALAPALVGVCGFVWLNAMLIRAFHHLGDVPFNVQAWSNSLPVQTGLTLLWSLTALVLMWLSARRGQRAPWMVGAALLGLVVLKLLVVDLSASGTVTRIVSFIGAGVLMLVIGYVAPLPGKPANPSKE